MRNPLERTSKIQDQAVRDSRIWDDEYRISRAIPSSSRILPSKALVLLSELLDLGNSKKILDAGCGNGRNALYLARKGCDVYAVDFSDAAVSQLKVAAIGKQFTGKIYVQKHDLLSGFPFSPSFFDGVVDSYVFCHMVDPEIKTRYRAELKRVVKTGGFVFSSVFSTDDEYYLHVAKRTGTAGKIVTDPTNQITKCLYSETEIKEFFSGEFTILYFVKFQFRDFVLGNTYLRSLFVLLLTK